MAGPHPGLSLRPGFRRGGGRIAFVPASFPTTGVIDAAREAELYHAPREAGAVARTLDAVARVGAADGVTLVHQPDDTLTPELMTKAEFAAESARENGDVVHKSPPFAAIMMRAALGALEARAEAA
ncbi:hypothetical protein GCM10011358_05780 [Sinisalibacter lacisalsi]|uniref:Uncharacterized protein n=1 Tax=Sinisalibacter lacisalsi TaxID=1526570 RepID=A0ABQ1QFI7_9RHOB|nr:hypothetical protein GCM10011358_05780 [Sinisalibacter lacisalsi]